MMTLDEAISHAEDVAKEQDYLCSITHPAMQLSNYSKCAEEHRQLAEWLKDYKRMKEQAPCENSIVEWKKDFKRYVNSLSMSRDDYNGIMEYVNELLVTSQSKTGRWIEEIDDYGKAIGYHCDKCYEDSGFTTDCKWDFCPNCGCCMAEGEKTK